MYLSLVVKWQPVFEESSSINLTNPPQDYAESDEIEKGDPSMI
jgi:hypothetical protein